jgi:NTE family protein
VTASHALVLGGGGVAGIAWQTGVLHGMAEAGLDVTSADFMVGTSAGATVTSQLGSGTPIGEWFERQVDPAQQSRELQPTGMSVADLWETMARLLEEVPDAGERRRRIGAMALSADTVSEAVRRAVVAGRFADHTWPERHIATVAVDADTGHRRVFDASSGVGLVDAVAASSAVPGIWPPVTIGGCRYIDGGVFSLCNADLVEGYERVLVIAPMVDPELDHQLELVKAHGLAQVVSPDDDSLAAFGPDALDPSVRTPVARAGYVQGRRSASSVADLWTG